MDTNNRIVQVDQQKLAQPNGEGYPTHISAAAPADAADKDLIRQALSKYKKAVFWSMFRCQCSAPLR